MAVFVAMENSLLCGLCVDPCQCLYIVLHVVTILVQFTFVAAVSDHGPHMTDEAEFYARPSCPVRCKERSL